MQQQAMFGDRDRAPGKITKTSYHLSYADKNPQPATIPSQQLPHNKTYIRDCMWLA